MAIILPVSPVTTVQNLIHGALRLIRVKGRGRPISGEDSQSAFDALNMLLAGLSLDNPFAFAVTKESFSISAGQATYTIGPTGDMVTVRPEEIRELFFNDGVTDYPIKFITESEWTPIADKTVTGRPERVWYNPTFPDGTLYFEYYPDTNYTLNVHSLKALTAFTSLTQTVELPPGYERMIKYNLALELAPEYGRPVSQEVFLIAQQTLDAVKRRNRRTPVLVVDPALQLPEQFNINKG